MEAADTGVVIVWVTSHRDVAHLGMPQPVDRLTIDQGTTSDPGADGDIDKSCQPPGRPPPALAQCCAIDIGVQTDRDIDRIPDRTDQVCPRPALLGCDPDTTANEAQWTECGDSDRFGRLLPQELDHPPQSLRRPGRGNGDFPRQVIGRRADRAQGLGAPDLHRPVLTHTLILPPERFRRRSDGPMFLT